MKKLMLLTATFLLIAASLSAETTLFRYSGTLDYGDARGLDGAYVDQFAVNAEAGTRVGVLAVSVDFSPRLEAALERDAWEMSTRSLGSVYAERVVSELGSVTFKISAGSMDSGSYSIRVFQVSEDAVAAKNTDPREG